MQYGTLPNKNKQNCNKVIKRTWIPNVGQFLCVLSKMTEKKQYIYKCIFRIYIYIYLFSARQPALLNQTLCDSMHWCNNIRKFRPPRGGHCIALLAFFRGANLQRRFPPIQPIVVETASSETFSNDACNVCLRSINLCRSRCWIPYRFDMKLFHLCLFNLRIVTLK